MDIGWTIGENVALVIAFLGLVILMVISISEKCLGSALLALIVVCAIGYFNVSLVKSRIAKSYLVEQLNPAVPVHGYKWVGAKAWVLYKDGKPENIVVYEK